MNARLRNFALVIISQLLAVTAAVAAEQLIPINMLEAAPVMDGSGRTNPAGLTHDKSTIISKKPIRESFRKDLDSGEVLYIYRPSDAGEAPYIIHRYFKKQQDMMPKDRPRQSLAEGMGDVTAKGIVVFTPGSNIKGAGHF